MDADTARRMAQAAHETLRRRTPDGMWVPPLLHVAEALAAALRTRRQLEDVQTGDDE